MKNAIFKNLIFIMSGVVPAALYGSYVFSDWKAWAAIIAINLSVALRDATIESEVSERRNANDSANK